MNANVNAGDLKRPITIQQASTTKDSFGGESSAWTDVQTTWASIRAVTSKEVYALGAGFDSQVTHTVTIRYNPSVTVSAGMRISYCNRYFTIQAVSDPDEGRVLRHLMCLEQTK